MIPVYFFFRKTDINAVNSPFLQILLHGLRPSNKAKQKVAGVVVAFLDSHSQQFLQREIAALRETLPEGAPGIFHQLFRTYADDLFQIGCIGLIKAIDNFDVNQQVKLSTYAVPMIIGEIRRYLRDNSQIRVSRSLKDTAYKAIYAKERLMKQSQKEPTINEIAAEIGVDKEEIVMALDAVQSPVSLYEPVYCDGGDTLYVMDQVSDTKNVEDNWVSNLALKDAIGRLAPREKEIIRLRFFRGRTQMEVAKEIGISQAQVSRLEKNALKTMRRYLL